jgi:micrococcal nuclease
MGRRIQRRHKVSLLSLLVALVIIIAQQQGWIGSAEQGAATKQPGMYSIDHFVDGDTIAVKMDNKVETIRFIGIDTPETHKPNTPVQCYGPAAAAYTKSQIGNGQVKLATVRIPAQWY